MPERVTAGHLATVLHDPCHVLFSRVLRVLGEERSTPEEKRAIFR